VAFAEGTTVAVSKTRGEIENLITKYGATRFAYGYIEDRAAINFVANGRLVRFTVPLPGKDDKRVRARALRLSRSNYRIDPPKLDIAIQEEDRRRWRCLLLAIKSKFTTVESGIESFEEAFLANIVTTENMTVFERIKLEESGIKMLPAVGQ
jgi:hypothetical protein